MNTNRNIYSTGRLTATYAAPTGEREAKTGLHALELDSKQDGLLYVPHHYSPDRPAALAVMLHGSGGNPEQGLWLLQQYADAHNLILLAPASRKYTWDVIVSDTFGPDVIYLDQAIAQTFATYAIDPKRMALGGFSDGASYALCLGLTNGDLFTHVIAFSPGFAFNAESHGTPHLFLSHGTKDSVLPIDACSRRLVKEFRSHGVEVNYHEFEGEHEIPATISASAVEWFTR